MTPITLLVLLLGAPVACPPDQGNIRWDNFTFNYKAYGKKHDVIGTLWDRDRNGKPSRGDLLRIDSATAGGNAVGVSELYVTLGPGLAKQFDRRFKKIGARLDAVCESRFEVEGVPRIASASALAKYLREQDPGRVKVSPTERVEQAMTGWAEERCKPGQHTDEKVLREWLYKRAMKAHGGVGKGRVKTIARDVASKFALQCAHMEVPKLTFD